MAHQFVFLELRTHNVAKAKKFYANLFGWKMKQIPMGKSSYLMVEGAGAARGKEWGVGMVKNPAPKGFSSHWTPYVQVKDIKALTGRAKKLGARVIQEVRSTPWGFMSTLIDPTGAVLSLWQKPGKGSER